jgi:hypothetical protein
MYRQIPVMRAKTAMTRTGLKASVTRSSCGGFGYVGFIKKLIGR